MLLATTIRTLISLLITFTKKKSVSLEPLPPTEGLGTFNQNVSLILDRPPPDLKSYLSHLHRLTNLRISPLLTGSPDHKQPIQHYPPGGFSECSVGMRLSAC